MSLREHLLALETPTKTLTPKGWPEPVTIKALTVGDFSGERWTSLVEQAGQAAALVVMSCYAADGKRLFQDGDIYKIAALPAVVVTELSNELSVINGLGPAGLEEAAKNCESSPGEPA